MYILINSHFTGVEVRIQNDTINELMHHKFLLIDTTTATNDNAKDDDKSKKPSSIIPKNGILMTGSMNWTMQALTMNWDNFLITSNKKLIDQYQREFNIIWEIFGLKKVS